MGVAKYLQRVKRKRTRVRENEQKVYAMLRLDLWAARHEDSTAIRNILPPYMYLLLKVLEGENALAS